MKPEDVFRFKIFAKKYLKIKAGTIGELNPGMRSKGSQKLPEARQEIRTNGPPSVE